MQVSSEQRDVIAPREDTDGAHAECVGVNGVLILHDAKSIMTIDFGTDVKQCVCVSGTESSLVKRVMERLVLLIQGLVGSGEIRTEKWKGKCFRRKHVKMLQWSDAKDVIGQSFLKWCCGLSRAMRASSRAARVRKAAILSEASCEVMEKLDAYVCVRLKGHYPRIHEETTTTSSTKRASSSDWIGRAP